MNTHRTSIRLWISAIAAGGLLLAAPHGADARQLCECGGTPPRPPIDDGSPILVELRPLTGDSDDPFDCDRHRPHDSTPCAI